MDDRYGHFDADGREYVITTVRTPRPWYNYFWNDAYNGFTSQVGQGEGFVQDALGRRVLLVADRAVYLMDAESRDFWTAHALPVQREFTDFTCTHGLGYTIIRSAHAGIECEWRMFVPTDLRGEVWTLTIRNRRASPARLKVFPYVKSALDNPFRPQAYFMATTDYDAALDGILCKHYATLDEHHEIYPFFAASPTPAGFDCKEFAFIGDYGDKLAPQALIERGGCTNSPSICEKVCFALEQPLELAPGAEAELHAVMALAFSPEEARATARTLLAPGGVARAFAAAREAALAQIEGVRIETPDPSLDPLFNYWLKHQANMGSRWARVRHNGYRDMSCDCDCLGHVNPELAWTRIKRVLGYQYSNGYAPRTFLDGQIIDRNFTDNTVWLTYAVHTAIMELGAPARLEEPLPFNDGSVASVYEHIRRSVEWLWNFRGANGLIKIWGGDWNDCIERIGPRGRGTTVWLSQAWVRANRQFAELARARGRDADAATADARGAEMIRTINAVAWAGDYYVRAFTDDGERVGAPECEEGKIYINPQIWGILAGSAPDERARQSMAMVDRLLNTPLGSRMSWPSYTRRYENIGHMSEKHAGVNENGGVYLHPCAWKIAADSLLKRHDKVEEELTKILPGNNTYYNKRCEPYIACNCYFPEDTGYLYGSSGQSWRTGSGAWMMKSIIYSVLGIQATLEGLRLDPCLPPSWRQCRVHKTFRGARYHIEYRNPTAAAHPAIKVVRVNGAPFAGAVLPCAAGAQYTVEVELG